MTRPILTSVFALILLLSCEASEQNQTQTPDYQHNNSSELRVVDTEAPDGFTRQMVDSPSFALWLRHFEYSDNDTVYLHSGQVKNDQNSHWKVLKIDIGKRDLQQCADAVMRLRAEYLWDSDQKEKIQFHFTSGHLVKWTDYAKGIRPKISGSKVTFHRTARADHSYKSFRKYMDLIFSYCGTRSLHGELVPVAKESEIQIGDVFIQKGTPYGHAVIVMDVAENEEGQKAYMLVQSYMPAQSIHILKNPIDSRKGPWYFTNKSEELITPHWRFLKSDLRRFK